MIRRVEVATDCTKVEPIRSPQDPEYGLQRLQTMGLATGYGIVGS